MDKELIDKIEKQSYKLIFNINQFISDITKEDVEKIDEISYYLCYLLNRLRDADEKIIQLMNDSDNE